MRRIAARFNSVAAAEGPADDQSRDQRRGQGFDAQAQAQRAPLGAQPRPGERLQRPGGGAPCRDRLAQPPRRLLTFLRRSQGGALTLRPGLGQEAQLRFGGGAALVLPDGILFGREPGGGRRIGPALGLDPGLQADRQGLLGFRLDVRQGARLGFRLEAQPVLFQRPALGRHAREDGVFRLGLDRRPLGGELAGSGFGLGAPADRGRGFDIRLGPSPGGRQRLGLQPQALVCGVGRLALDRSPIDGPLLGLALVGQFARQPGCRLGRLGPVAVLHSLVHLESPRCTISGGTAGAWPEQRGKNGPYRWNGRRARCGIEAG